MIRDQRADPLRSIGLISDTHGLLRPEALDALQGSDLIIHAGDVGKGPIVEQLQTVAPVVAVRGNIDTHESAAHLPATAIVEAGQNLIYILHDIAQLDFDPAASQFNVVVSGHSHKPGHNERNGVLYINPGSAGPRRFHLPVTVARLDLNGPPPAIYYVTLTDDPAART